MSKTYIGQQIRQRGKAAVLVMLDAQAKKDRYLAELARLL